MYTLNATSDRLSRHTLHRLCGENGNRHSSRSPPRVSTARTSWVLLDTLRSNPSRTHSDLRALCDSDRRCVSDISFSLLSALGQVSSKYDVYSSLTSISTVRVDHLANGVLNCTHELPGGGIEAVDSATVCVVRDQ